MPRIDSQGGSIEYLNEGSGDPVVLLHSSGASGAQWRALTQRLASNYRVIAPDLYGYGASSGWHGQSEFTLEREAGFVLSLLDRLSQPAHLVGHSYGGAVALRIARSRADLVRSLTVIEPVAFHLLRGGSERDAAGLREIEGVTAMVGRALASGDYDGGYGRFVDYWSGSGTWAGMPAAKRATLAPQLAKVALDFHATLHEPATPADFRMMPAPTLVLQGASTRLPTQCICERLTGALPDARLVTVDGAGHMLPLTHREAVNDLIADQLEVAAALSW
jgi:pimeloyl-ACP methyl ester carboxylesterase